MSYSLNNFLVFYEIPNYMDWKQFLPESDLKKKKIFLNKGNSVSSKAGLVKNYYILLWLIYTTFNKRLHGYIDSNSI